MALMLTQEQQLRMEVLNLLKGQNLYTSHATADAIKFINTFVDYVKNGLDKPKTLV